jgi:hypothetical protein
MLQGDLILLFKPRTAVKALCQIEAVGKIDTITETLRGGVTQFLILSCVAPELQAAHASTERLSDFHASSGLSTTTDSAPQKQVFRDSTLSWARHLAS